MERVYEVVNIKRLRLLSGLEGNESEEKRVVGPRLGLLWVREWACCGSENVRAGGL